MTTMMAVPRIAILSIVLACSSNALLAAEPDVDTYVARSHAEKANHIESMTREVASLKARKRRDVLAWYRATRWEFPEEAPTASQYVKTELAERKARIESLKSAIEKWSDPKLPYYSTTAPRKPGEIGMLSDVRVIQILDKRNSLIGFISYNNDGWLALNEHDRRKKPSRPPSENIALYWLQGINTSDFRDGQHISPTGIFIVDGNRTYETDTGTNTVLVIRPFDIAPFEERFTVDQLPDAHRQ